MKGTGRPKQQALIVTQGTHSAGQPTPMVTRRDRRARQRYRSQRGHAQSALTHRVRSADHWLTQLRPGQLPPGPVYAGPRQRKAKQETVRKQPFVIWDEFGGFRRDGRRVR